MISIAKITIVAIGDSITYGYPLPPEYSWTALAAERLGTIIINKGICGETTGDMLARFEQEVLPYKPDYVIIMGGTNDAFLAMPVREIADNIEKMVGAARKEGITSLLGIPIPSNYTGDEAILCSYRNWMRGFAGENGIRLIDFYSVMRSPDGLGLKAELHTDGVHPNLEGYKVMADEAVKTLEAITA